MLCYIVLDGIHGLILVVQVRQLEWMVLCLFLGLLLIVFVINLGAALDSLFGILNLREKQTVIP